MAHGYTFIFIGNVGAGETTQAEAMVEQFQLERLSTGEVLREEVRRQTPLGLLLKEDLAAGKFASDEVALEIVRNRMAASECSSFVLDGVPRTLAQANRLATMAADKQIPELVAIHLDVPEAICRERLHLRWLHGTPRRSDDSPDVVEKRFVTYYELTEPILSGFGSFVRRVASDQSQAAVTHELSVLLQSYGLTPRVDGPAVAFG